MKEKISEYISFLDECFEGKLYTLEDVSGGRSYDIKIKVSCNSKDYIFKVIEGNLPKDESNSSRVAWYQALAMIRNENPCVLGPVRYGFVNNHVVTLTEWIYGEQLNSVFEERADLMPVYGEAVGKLLYTVHHQPNIAAALAQKGAKITPWVMKTATELVGEVKRCGIDFPEMHKALAYLENNKALVSEERACVVHNDIRPENFISTTKNLYIYDFDSGTFNDAYADFTYLTVMSEAKFRVFSHAVIKAYFGEEPPLEFWKTNLYFSIMKLLDYAIYKYRKTGKMIVNQAKNFIEVFDCYENPVPHWWRQLEEAEKENTDG